MNQKYNHLQKLKRSLYFTKFFAHVLEVSENVINISSNKDLQMNSEEEEEKEEEEEEKDKKKSKSSSVKHELSANSSIKKSSCKKQCQI